MRHLPIFCQVWLSVILLVTFGARSLMAMEAAPHAQDPIVEARMIHISEELRCLVCQNESLASSHAE